MPDITMCTGSNKEMICPLKDSCYRYTATPTKDRQSYFSKLPVLNRVYGCDYFWDNKSNVKVK